jgi:hypothetical protein
MRLRKGGIIFLKAFTVRVLAKRENFCLKNMQNFMLLLNKFVYDMTKK